MAKLFTFFLLSSQLGWTVVKVGEITALAPINFWLQSTSGCKKLIACLQVGSMFLNFKEINLINILLNRGILKHQWL